MIEELKKLDRKINKMIDNLYNFLRYPRPVNLKTADGIIGRISPEILSGIYDINNLERFGEYQSALREFKEKFDNIPVEINNRGFYDNIVRTGIEEKDELEVEKFSGIYKHKQRMIGIRKDEKFKKQIFFHELLHLCSTYEDGYYTTIGFQQMDGRGNEIGRGLNEGFTELFTRRFFYQESNQDLSYMNQQMIANFLCKQIGIKNALKLYLNADLKGLYDEMCIVMDEDLALGIIKDADEMYKMTDEGKQREFTFEIMARLRDNAMKRINKSIEEGKITEEFGKMQRVRYVMLSFGKNLDQLTSKIDENDHIFVIQNAYSPGCIVTPGDTIARFDTFFVENGFYEPNIKNNIEMYDKFIKFAREEYEKFYEEQKRRNEENNTMTENNNQQTAQEVDSQDRKAQLEAMMQENDNSQKTSEQTAVVQKIA